MRKSHSKIWKRWLKFLDGERIPINAEGKEDISQNDDMQLELTESPEYDLSLAKKSVISHLEKI